MRKELFVFACGAAIALATAAFASQTPTTNEQTTSTNNQSEKIICRYIAHEGMVMPKPYCGTQRAWDDAMRLQQQEVADLQRRSFAFRPH